MPRLAPTFVLLACFIGPSDAQEPNAEPPRTEIERTFFTSPSYRTFVERSFNAFEAPLSKAECPELKILEYTAHKIVRPLQFTKTETGYSISGGSWIAVPEIDRCGKPAKRRILMSVAALGRLSPIPLAPGDHRGELALEMDTLRIVLPGIMAHASCQDTKQFYLLDVVNIRDAGNGNWEENWTAEACGKVVKTTVRYIKDATGTTIRATIAPL